MQSFKIFLISCFIICSCNPTVEKPGPEIQKKKILNPKLGFRPNILWLVAEDLSPYIPSFGDSTIATPALDKLAASGLCYDNFFSPHPVCAPARASIITGMYANHIGASHMRTGPWFRNQQTQEMIDEYALELPEGITPYEAIPSPQVKMFTEYLRAAGYYCTNNSKEDYQFRKTMTAWDESSSEAHWRNRAKGQPFFSVFNFSATHESQIWEKAKDSLWVDEKLVVPVPPYLPDNELGKKDIRRMYSNILEMDNEVGKILEQLKIDGLLDSTIVIWYSDHGGPLPRQKRLLYDSGIKVPMIIRFPGGQFAGLRDERMVSFVDLAPTMLSLANIEPPNYLDGKAFLGQYIRSKEPQYVFGAADRFDELTDQIRSVTDSRFKYIKYYQPEKPMYLEVAYRNQMPIMQELLRLRNDGKLTEYQALWFRSQKPHEELFDLQNDPHEIHNLAQDTAYADKLLELRAACEKWIADISDTGMQPEKQLLEKLWQGATQPITADPVFAQNNGTLEITSKTEGASIGYKITTSNENPVKMPWSVYTQPIEIPKDSKLIAVAHRIGYKRSQEVWFPD